MMTPLHSIKLRNEHVTRPALVYVRQSTLMQVRDNTASTTRQYQLAQRAQDLGWPEHLVVIIDQDQGRSGASSAGRDGFEYLIAEVGLGRAGAVLCLEASRLARSSSDWYRLIEICALTDTLVIDEDGVYDPGQYNDRLLLGFRGTMSEAELHWLHGRLVGGKLEKAQQGTLRFRLPVGLVYDAAGQIRFDPDEEIQHAVRQVFEVFATAKSALAVVKHFADHGLEIPDRLWQRARKGERGVAAAASCARAVHLAQSILRRGIRLWAHQDPATAPAGRSASRQGLHAPGQARRLADDFARSSPGLYQLDAVSPQSGATRR